MAKNLENKQTVTLIENVRKGDQEAFVKLLKQYEPLINSSVLKFSQSEIAKSHEDDLRQEATLVFYNAILNYDIDSEGVEFGLYAKICINNALISQLHNLEKRKAEQCYDSFENENAQTYEEPSHRIIEQERIEKIDSVIRSSLSPFEYSVWCMYVSGKTAKEISLFVGKEEKSVANAIYRIRKKLRKLLG